MRVICFTVTVLSLVFYTGVIQAQTIITIAGTGSAGYNGDNKAATIASLNQPTGVITDNAGNVIITDFLNSRIRKIDVNGFITTIAGTAVAGYNGDNINAINSNLYRPQSPVFDQMGNLYFTDGLNNRIRKISAAGIITTIAGTGTPGYNGDNISAVSAQTNYATDGVAVDASGNVFIADTYNHRIRKVSTSGIITTVAGSGVAGYNGDNIAATNASINRPYGLVVDAAGTLYFADGLNHRIRKVSTSGIITTLAGTGNPDYNGDNIAATAATLHTPQGIAVDGAGNVYISDSYNNRIRKINKNTGIITTVVGTGTAGYNGDNITATLAQITSTVGIAFDAAGNLLIADLGNHRIRKVNNVGIILPLNLTKFTAQLQNGSGLLQWQTTNEVNTQSFGIESSQDGVKFFHLGFVNAKSTTSINTYSFIDSKITGDIVYYRLKMIDKDGKFTYSSTIALKFGAGTVSLNLFPNPAQSRSNLFFTSATASKYNIQIADMSGKIMMRKNGVAFVGTNKIMIDLQNFTNGVYILMFSDVERKKSILKFVKN